MDFLQNPSKVIEEYYSGFSFKYFEKATHTMKEKVTQ